MTMKMLNMMAIMMVMMMMISILGSQVYKFISRF